MSAACTFQPTNFAGGKPLIASCWRVAQVPFPKWMFVVETKGVLMCRNPLKGSGERGGPRPQQTIPGATLLFLPRSLSPDQETATRTIVSTTFCFSPHPNIPYPSEWVEFPGPLGNLSQKPRQVQQERLISSTIAASSPKRIRAFESSNVSGVCSTDGTKRATHDVGALLEDP